MSGDWNRLLKRFHPERMRWPESAVYNALSGTEIFLKHYDMVAQHLASLGPPRSILDIGTGPGRLLIAIRKSLPDARITGIDLSTSMVVQATRNLRTSGMGSSIRVSVADANALPFTDGAFDCLISTASLHHWKSPLRALSEAYRVLKVSGYALLYDLVRNLPRKVRREVTDQFGSFRVALMWLHSFEEPFLSSEEMASLVRRSDFTVEGTLFVGAFCCLVLRKHSHAGSGMDEAPP